MEIIFNQTLFILQLNSKLQEPLPLKTIELIKIKKLNEAWVIA
jgi:hypothetical protein